MKALQLIEALQALVAEHGDLSVTTWNDRSGWDDIIGEPMPYSIPHGHHSPNLNEGEKVISIG